jgi:hypothetical protein
MKNSNPIAPVAMEGSSRINFVAATAAIIRTTAPQRSTMGARLKKAHHTAIAKVPAIPPRMLYSKASGQTLGTANLSSPISATTTTPGHSRSGLRAVFSPIFALVI